MMNNEENAQVSSNPQQSDQSWEYEDAFELTGNGIVNHLALAACSLIFIHSCLEMGAIGYIITPAECDLFLTISEKSMINSGIFIGILLTAIIWGTVSDRFGRRRVMLPALVGAVVTSFCSSLCSTFWTMLFFRIITGCLVSASSATVLVYLGELQTSNHRDWSISFTMTVTQVIFIMLPLIAWVIIPGTWSFNLGPVLIRPWRVYMWFWGLTGLCGALILLLLPESPRYILAAKGPHAALLVLARMYAWNYGKKKHEFPVTSMRLNARILRHSNVTFKDTLKDTAELFRPPIRRCFLITHYAMFIIFFLAYGFYIWLPDFINDVVADVSTPHSICDLLTVKHMRQHELEEIEAVSNNTDCQQGKVKIGMYPVAVGMEIAYLIPFLLVMFIINKFDKKKIYGVVMIICSIGLIVCSLVPQIVVAMIFIIIGINCITGAVVLSAFAVDTFPTSLRSLTMCTMYMMGHIGAIAGNNILGVMEGVLCHVMFIIIAIAALASACFIWLFWPDPVLVRQEMEKRRFSY